MPLQTPSSRPGQQLCSGRGQFLPTQGHLQAATGHAWGFNGTPVEGIQEEGAHAWADALLQSLTNGRTLNLCWRRDLSPFRKV